MPDFLHRTTKRLQTSVSYTDLLEPIANYIESPDLSAVTGFESKYWSITGDNISLMSQAERDQVDADELTARIASHRANEVSIVDATQPEGMRVRALIEQFNKRDNYLISRIIELQDALDAMKASSGAVENIRTAIPSSWSATSTRTRADVVTSYKSDINSGSVDGS